MPSETTVPDRALQLRSTVSGDAKVVLSLAEVDVPVPGPDQVLVRVDAAPVNPSDLGVLLAGAALGDLTAGEGPGGLPWASAPLGPAAMRAAAARVGKPLPVGNEGAGTVVAAGSGELARGLLGKVVAVAAGGMYSQYRVVDAADCLRLPEGTTPAEGASAFVNPLTALGMVETMRSEGHHGLVHTAAASNLGQMLVRLCREEGVALVNVVRTPAQGRILAELGAEHVCDSSSERFMDDLISALTATGATLAFDAIGGGTIASRILTAMEAVAVAGAEPGRYGSSVYKQVYIYGGLDRGPTQLTRSFGMAWGVGGWLLTPFLAGAGPAKVDQLRARVVAGLRTTFASAYGATIDLPAALDPAVIAEYGRQATGAKALITPNA